MVAGLREPAGLPADYAQLLAEIKSRVVAARTRVALAVNSELIKLYWEIGREVLSASAARAGARRSSTRSLPICAASSRR